MFDRFQIVLGHYVFCMLWHGGQTCPLYARLCRIDRYFKPGYRGLCLDNPENEMAKEVYYNQCLKHGFHTNLWRSPSTGEICGSLIS